MSPALVYVVTSTAELTQTFVRLEVSGLRRRGVEVHVVALYPPEVDGRLLPPLSPTAAVSLLLWMAQRPRAMLRVARILARLDGDVPPRRLLSLVRAAQLLGDADVRGVHAHFAWQEATWALVLGALLSSPASVTAHAKDLYVRRRNPLLVPRLALLHRVLTISDYNRRLLLDELGVPAERVHVVPCGVEMPTETAGAVAARAPLLVSVGRLVPKKGHDLTIRALAHLRDLPEVRLRVVGDGPQRGALERLVTELGLSDRVELIGALSHAEALTATATARVAVLACRRADDGDMDGVPVVLREAMAAGTPVVTTRVSGIPEILDDSSAWLVESEDVVALAAALREALTDSGEAQRRADAARARVRREGTADLQARLVEEILLGARRLGGRARPAAPTAAVPQETGG